MIVYIMLMILLATKWTTGSYIYIWASTYLHIYFFLALTTFFWPSQSHNDGACKPEAKTTTKANTKCHNQCKLWMRGEIFASFPAGRDVQNVVLEGGIWRMVCASAPTDIRLRCVFHYTLEDSGLKIILGIHSIRHWWWCRCWSAW